MHTVRYRLLLCCDLAFLKVLNHGTVTASPWRRVNAPYEKHKLLMGTEL